jgi:hypothetical protein
MAKKEVQTVESDPSLDEGLRIPHVWTLVTSLFVETNVIVMLMELVFINRLLVYITGRNQDDLLVISESMWTYRQIMGMMAFVGVCTGMPLVFIRYLAYLIIGNSEYL